MRRTHVLAALVAVLTASLAARADFIGSAAAKFGTPTPSGSPVVWSTNAAGNELRSGQGMYGDGPNIYRIDGAAFNTPADAPFKVADLTYTNTVTRSDTNVDSAPVDFTLHFTAPPGIPDQEFTFRFNIICTLNTWDPVASADRLKIANVYSTTSFAIGEDIYTLKLIGFGPDVEHIKNEFKLFENCTTHSKLWAEITAPPPGPTIPLPAAVWSGLAGLTALTSLRSVRRMFA